MERIICLVIGYAFGLFQTGYFLGKLNGIDIRKKGSGNVGTTNVIRNLGWKTGLITFAGDALKAIAAVLIVRFVFLHSPMRMLLCTYAGFGAILGHDFPFYMHFKGGKGVATMAGTMIALLDIRIIIIGILCFFIPALLTKYVSLGALCLATSFLVSTILFGFFGQLGLSFWLQAEMDLIVAVIAVLCFWQHRGNIQRLIAGNERKLHMHGNQE